ncbi:High-potential cytochrome c [Thalassovita gelatinovora]|uniref:High-potential cytochrome c n=1 Tax=Thalassovita gelatinovora TaxID=53501 RepID=A0A0P1F4E5_THAGE|nr:cytochrome c [Thalassovita gelatinovora]QIZ79306.1 cytochrome c [Thalassovita gelatinovora]CUH62542.1 High-potential cytochrome c [Thalassovita gelatinovora]SEQ06242.1 Cytochrome c556 [Thalassovita gelatinovora]
MKVISKCVLAAAFVTGLGSAVFAENDAATDSVIKARQGQMQLYAHNLGLLGGMAKGAVPYNADAAKAAASSLVLLTQLDASRLWPQGSDEMSADNTRALPDLWDNQDDVMKKAMALSEAAAAMEIASGTSLESLQGAMGPLGGACGGCHKAYRAPEN